MQYCTRFAAVLCSLHKRERFEFFVQKCVRRLTARGQVNELWLSELCTGVRVIESARVLASFDRKAGGHLSEMIVREQTREKMPYKGKAKLGALCNPCTFAVHCSDFEPLVLVT